MMAVDTVAQVDWIEQHPILRDPFVLVTARDVTPEAILSRPFVRYAADLLIGRQIEAQLRRSGVTPPRGFEFSSNQALFAMTAELGGWAITTALAYFGTPFAGDLVRAHPLLVPAFSRTLALHARAGALGDLPVQMAEDIRGCLRDRIVKHAADRVPFLDESLKVIR